MVVGYKDKNGNITTEQSIGDAIQVTTIPSPSSSLEGTIYQYIGTTDTNYTNGYFYKCVQGETVGTYEWTPIEVQSGGGGTQVQSDWGQMDTEAVDFIKNKPTLGTASAKDVATSGDASATQVVMGNDSRLNNSISSTSTTSPITDSADGMVQGLTVYGRSEVVDGEIESVGDDGLTVTTCGKNYFNINGEVNYKWTGTAFVVDTDPATMSTVNDGVLTTKTSLAVGHTRGQIINVEKNSRYTLSFICDYLPQDGKIGVAVYGVNDDGSLGTYKAQIDSTVVGEVQSASFTSSTNRIYVEFGTLRVSGASTYPTGSTYSRIQLEKGNNVTQYEQYRGSTANITTALPLRGISDTVRDKLICTADVKQVETVCGAVDLGTLNWAYYSASATPIFYTVLSNINAKAKNANMLCTLYTPENDFWNEPNNDMKIATSTNDLFISNSQYTNPSDFKAAMNGVMLVYELATPVTTPLTDAEISMFRGLRTYDSTTYIDATDAPTMTIDYLLNTNNGKAVADIQKNLQEQIDEGSGSANFPAGGTTGQALVKASDADNDVEWGNISSVRIDDTTPSASTVFSSRKTDILIKTPMTGASQYADGTVGAVPQPLSGDDQKALFGDGTYHTIYTSASGSTIIVKTTEASLYGRTVTLSMGTQSFTATIGATGEATFTNVSFYGTVNVVADDGNGNYARGSANLTYFGTYVVSLTMNFATLNFISDNAALVGKNLDLKIGNKTITTFQLSLVVGTTDTYMGTVYVDRLATYRVDTMTDVGRVRGTVVVDTYTTYNVTVSTGEIYAFKINHIDSNPATCVTPYENEYGCDNLNFTPAHMDYTNDTFDYGSWTGQEFFFPKPCMLKYDGTVDYYLDPNDYSLRADGTPSNVADMNYAGNVMIEFPTVYFKRWQEGNYSYCIISDKQLGADFHAYAHHDVNGNVLPYIYLATYNGSYDGTRLRSISGVAYHNENALTAGYIMSNTTRQQEIDFAQANNLAGYTGEGWYIKHKADWDMINDLLLLIGMSTDTQTTFGRGRDTGFVSVTNTGVSATGLMDSKGLFYGRNDDTVGVKVFGIEHWWANIWKSIAGWINNKGTQKVKMTCGQEDGSTVDGFNLDGAGYVAITNFTPTGTSGGYINTYITNEFGIIPKNSDGSDSTYLTDGMWFNNSQIDFAGVGGHSGNGARCGAFSELLNSAVSHAHWSIGAALSYKGIVT